MNTWDALMARRNVREFDDRPLSADDLDRVLEAGRRTPSSKNGQPWDLVVVTERDRLIPLSEVWQGAWPVAGSAATIVIVAQEPENQRSRDVLFFDLGQQAMAMTVAATGLGIGSGIAYVDDKDLAKRLLDLPDGTFAALLVTLGYPAAGPLKPLTRINRRPFDEVVHRERW